MVTLVFLGCIVVSCRWDVGMAMIEEIGDILTYISAIIIIHNDDSDAVFNKMMGIALLCFQGVSFLSAFLDNFFTVLDGAKVSQKF